MVGLDREFVASLVFYMTRVASDVREFKPVDLEEFVQSPPQVGIFELFEFPLRLPTPAVPFPTRHPLGQALPDVGTVGMERDFARLFEYFQATDHSHKFHLIVGRGRHAVRHFELFAGFSAAKDKGPSTGSRITAASAVGEKIDSFQKGHQGF